MKREAVQVDWLPWHAGYRSPDGQSVIRASGPERAAPSICRAPCFPGDNPKIADGMCARPG